MSEQAQYPAYAPARPSLTESKWNAEDMRNVA